MHGGKEKMPDFKKLMIQYRDYIIMAGLGLGLLSCIDATKIYELGLSTINQYTQFGLILVICFSLYTYFTLYMQRRKKRPLQAEFQFRKKPHHPLDDIPPPEERE